MYICEVRQPVPPSELPYSAAACVLHVLRARKVGGFGGPDSVPLYLINRAFTVARARARDAVSALESSYLLLRIPPPHASPRPSFSCVVTSTPEFIFTTELLAKSDFILRSFPLPSPLSPGPALSFYTLSAVSLVSFDVRADVTLA